jgi:large subunit ribosomal protein L17
MFSNMVASLIEHERIRTTDAKAKELRRVAERAITWATSVGGLVGDDRKKDAADRARVVHAMRMAGRVVKQRPALEKLFSEVGPRLMGRPGGYLRIMKVGQRHGDAAPVSIVELVDRAAAPEPEPEAKGGKAEKGQKKGAAQAAAPAEAAAAPKKKAKAAAPAQKAESAEKAEKPAKKKAATPKSPKSEE